LGGTVPVDRSAALRRVAEDASVRREMNRILHPEILDRLVTSGAQVFEVPLLIESCLQGLFRRVWVVTCGADEQFRRLEARLGDQVLAARVIGSQLPSEVKCSFADHIVRTNQPPFSVHSEVVSLARADGFV
jgi:dephospho-CoA kinase